MAVTWARATRRRLGEDSSRAEQPFRKEAEHRSGPKLNAIGFFAGSQVAHFWHTTGEQCRSAEAAEEGNASPGRLKDKWAADDYGSAPMAKVRSTRDRMGGGSQR